MLARAGSDVVRIVRATGATTLANQQERSGSITVDALRVYWTNPQSGAVNVAEKAGGVTAVMSTLGYVAGADALVVDDTSVYVAGAAGVLRVAPK